MDILHENLLGSGERGCFDGQFLLAMPGLDDTNFSRTVIYICAHTDSGAVGFILNRPQSISFSELMVQLELIEQEEVATLPASAIELNVQMGGPVDTGRGFVLHSEDYRSDATLPISEDLSLTATVDILRAITKGRGPKRATMMLGYSGWGAGQLEDEVSANGWLTCPAIENIIFDDVLDDKYERVFASIGIDPAMLSSECGQA
ncbi:YqgE/AlgH family protein [Hoeflea sp. TYP-13]|uniref:YqgE/AlgH family protein n=1 Tax=Hoeflea sp. TYP-13 TaxID=3230023 RepID=UPI0034C5D0B4